MFGNARKCSAAHLRLGASCLASISGPARRLSRHFHKTKNVMEGRRLEDGFLSYHYAAVGLFADVHAGGDVKVVEAAGHKDYCAARDPELDQNVGNVAGAAER